MNIFRNYLSHSKNYKWWVLVVIQIAVFLIGLDVTLLNLALPRITAYFQTTVTASQWLLSGYYLAGAAFLPIVGKLSDRMDRKPIFIGGFIVYSIGALLAAYAPNLTFMVAMRCLQGLGAAALLANTNVLTIAVFPIKQHALALGINGSVYSIGFSLGYLFGGYLVDNYGWVSIYFFAVTISLLGILCGFSVLIEKKLGTHSVRERSKFDFFGGILIILVIGIFMFAFQRWINTQNLDPLGFTLFAASICIAAYYLRYEKRQVSPILRVSLLKRPAVWVGLSVRLLSQILVAGCLLIIPFFAQIFLKFSTLQTGIFMLPFGVALFIFGPLGGIFSNKFGVRPITAIGFVLFGAALIILSELNQNFFNPIHYTRIVIQIGFGLFLFGIAMAFAVYPNNKMTLNAVPPDQTGSIAGFLWVMALVGNSFGAAFSSTMLNLGLSRLGLTVKELLSSGTKEFPADVLIPLLTSQSTAFDILSVLSLIGLALCFIKGSRKYEPR